MLTTLALAFLTSFPQPSFAQAKPAATQAVSLSAERRELAEIQLLLGADRKYAEAKERLATLKETLAKRTDADAKDLLAQVERLDQTVRRALGEAVPAAANPGADKVDEAVLAAIQREDFAFVRQLGKRAVPGLLSAVRSDPDTLPSDEQKDPLRVLRQIDLLAMSQLAGELLNEGGFFWKKRIARVLDVELTWNAALWTAATPQRWLGEGLAKTAEKYVEDADVGFTAFQFLSALAARAPVPTFPAILGRALRSTDPARREEAKKWAGSNSGLVGLAAFTSLLDEPDEDLRAFAVGALSEHFREDRTSLGRIDDPSPLVRWKLAEWLGRTDDTRWQAAEREALARLLADSEEFVRKEAWERLQKMTTVGRRLPISAAEAFTSKDGMLSHMVFAAPLDDEVYRSLLKSAERRTLCEIAPRLEASLCFELLSSLAAESVDEVVWAVSRALKDLPAHEAPEVALRLAGALFDNALLTDREDLRKFVSNLSGTRKGLTALVRWALERSDDEGIQQLIGRKDAGVFRNLSLLDPQLVTACLARVYALEPGTVLELVAKQYLVRSPELTRAMRDLARDARQPIELRVLALRESLGRGPAGEEDREIALGILDDPAWRDWDTARDATFALRRAIDDRSGLANTVIARVLRDPTIAADVQAALANKLMAAEPHAAEIVPLVLAHWPDEAWREPVQGALNAMGYVPALQDPAFLARAVHDGRIASAAFQVLGRLADPRYLPLLAEIAAKPEDQAQLASAARALIGYLDPGAVEPLLAAAAKVQDTDTRDTCLAHLEKIREYLDAKQRWAASKIDAKTREQVIAELVTQLAAKSDDVKVQALRALATWDAVETMPKLIELTTSGSKSVAAAAREALERLNAPKKD